MQRTTANGLAFAMTLASAVAAAQEPAAEALRDLVGARAAGAEQAMRGWGYAVRRAEATADARYMYWQQPETGECVVVRVADGRYESLTSAPGEECEATDSAVAPVPAGKDGFASICGVIVDGRFYRYRCTVSGVRPGKQGRRTELRYPDQTITLEWGKGDTLRVHFEGMRPVAAQFHTREGETRFVVEGKTYFYVSDRDRAALEVRDFHGS